MDAEEEFDLVAGWLADQGWDWEYYAHDVDGTLFELSLYASLGDRVISAVKIAPLDGVGEQFGHRGCPTTLEFLRMVRAHAEEDHRLRLRAERDYNDERMRRPF